MQALGLIELYGMVTAIEALDSALKAANVTLQDMTIVKGGLVTVTVLGDVGAVKAAMDASAAAAERVGRVISVHVIPRPHESIDKLLDSKEQKSNSVKVVLGEDKPKETKVAKVETTAKTTKTKSATTKKSKTTKKK